MNITIIHLSDLHFRMNWEESQDTVLDSFFGDLSKQMETITDSNIYIAFSGDFVLNGQDTTLFENFISRFDSELIKLGIPRNHRICVPGNHDVSRDIIISNYYEHEGIVTHNLDETGFNNYIDSKPGMILNKFSNYLKFQEIFCGLGISEEEYSGKGFELDKNIGVYCLNSSLLSSAGYNGINDEGRLAISTRNLQKWISKYNYKVRILIMHHPISWLNEWGKKELNNILKNNFNLCLTGHRHDQSLFHNISNDKSLVECSAPPLLTKKSDNLGYAFINLSDLGILDIQYRQWTKHNTFVTGVNFSNTDDGKVIINKVDFEFYNRIKVKLNDRLNVALQTFSSQPIFWISPVISTISDISKDADDKTDYTVNIDDITLNPESIFVKAPPQFGLTCLAHYLIKEAWEKHSSLWLYLDSKKFKIHKLDSAIKTELDFLNSDISDIKCIILDSWSYNGSNSLKLLNNLSNKFKEIPIIVMNTLDDSTYITEADNEPVILDRRFGVLFLHTLPRNKVRDVVIAYNSQKHIGDENIVLSKIINDLDVLNIHRTPLNCLTLLKVSEKYFDESPVNRTKMLEMVLFLLFNMDGIPTYKTKPDLKDCEYVLGRFCEKMIRSNNYYFTRNEFIDELTLFCSEKLIDLEVGIVFDVLYANSIIVEFGTQYGFRFSYWIFYFAAQRMHSDNDFAKYIFEENKYTAFPEIIEFYTGIDRNREDALQILLDDLKNVLECAKSKVGLHNDMNPYKLAEWQPSQDILEKIEAEISENVLNSKLPDSVKDTYADRDYNKLKPYDQKIHTILREYSLLILIQNMKAASRALRNSDYVNPEIKRKLIQEIINCWEFLTKTILVLSPILAVEGRVTYEGLQFLLQGDYGESFEKRINEILKVIPHNIVSWFKNDLFSSKMGPLLFDQLQSETNDISKHELALLLVNERPRNWKKHIEDYIASIHKNSFYLLDIFENLRVEYRYSFANTNTLQEIAYLIKMGLAKHDLGIKKPGLDKIKNVSNKILPERRIEESNSK